MSDRRPNAIDRILRTREAEQRGLPKEDPVVFTQSENRPQMSFSVRRADGTLDGFLYHNLDNVNLVERLSEQYLSFGHRGKIVTISGRHLDPIFHAIMGHTLMEIHECRPGDEDKDGTLISRIEVSVLQ